MLQTLRQPRYAALVALMTLVAIACVGAGTWQIYRFENKRHANDVLRINDHRAPAPVGQLLPLVGDGSAPSTRAVEFRTVRVTGRYDAAAQTLVRDRTMGDDTGFLIVTPLRTAAASLLVVRGFLAQTSSGAVPPLPEPPLGTVTITARLQAPETVNDRYGQAPPGQVQSINPSQQAAHLSSPVYNGYAQLDAGQPGTAGLHALPAPGLSNPAGGAVEPQHFAYIIQWYLFAALALAAPVVMARSEVKQSTAGVDVRPKQIGLLDDADHPAVADPAADGLITEPAPEDLREAKLADRYGRAGRR